VLPPLLPATPMTQMNLLLPLCAVPVRAAEPALGTAAVAGVVAGVVAARKAQGGGPDSLHGAWTLERVVQAVGTGSGEVVEAVLGLAVRSDDIARELSSAGDTRDPRLVVMGAFFARVQADIDATGAALAAPPSRASAEAAVSRDRALALLGRAANFLHGAVDFGAFVRERLGAEVAATSLAPGAGHGGSPAGALSPSSQQQQQQQQQQPAGALSPNASLSNSSMPDAMRVLVSRRLTARALLRRRVAWLLGRWSSEIPVTALAEAYSIVCVLLADPSTEVSAAAAEALVLMVEDWTFDAEVFAPYIAPALQALLARVNAPDDDDDGGGGGCREEGAIDVLGKAGRGKSGGGNGNDNNNNSNNDDGDDEDDEDDGLLGDDDTRVAALRAVGLLVERAASTGTDATSTYLAQLALGPVLHSVPALWQRAEASGDGMLKLAVARALVCLVPAAASGPAGVQGLFPFAVPLIGMTLGMESSDSVYVLEESLELWEKIMGHIGPGNGGNGNGNGASSALAANAPANGSGGGSGDSFAELTPLLERLATPLSYGFEHLPALCRILSAYAVAASSRGMDPGPLTAPVRAVLAQSLFQVSERGTTVLMDMFHNVFNAAVAGTAAAWDPLVGIEDAAMLDFLYRTFGDALTAIWLRLLAASDGSDPTLTQCHHLCALSRCVFVAPRIAARLAVDVAERVSANGNQQQPQANQITPRIVLSSLVTLCAARGSGLSLPLGRRIIALGMIRAATSLLATEQTR
jgi:hypothetical protein